MVCGASLNQSSRQRRRLFAEAGPSSPFQRILGPPHQLVQHRMDLISSSILGPPCERVFNAALEEYTLVSDAEEEIKSLAFTVSVIKGLLQDAERKQVEDAAIRNWLKGLKQVLFDAEDVLDEIATDEALRRRDTNGTRSVTRRAAKVRKIISSLFSVGAASASHAAAHRIKDIKKKFDTISRLKDRLGLRVLNENSCSAIGRKLETSSLLPNEANIIGRDDEKQNLQKLLLEPMKATEAKSSESNVHVIAVVGMGGVGKTTLVKHAYNNPAVGEHFQPRMWVCVSNDFDVKRITGEIMDAASSSEKAKEFYERSNWDVAQKGLQGKLEGKRFLLVLDDVWEEDPSKWEDLCTPLLYGGQGSKIIVTTRSQKVSNITRGTSILLKGLSSHDLWSIFQRYAFDDHDLDKHPQLILVGRQIVGKLEGLPLAAKTIGRLLYSNPDVKHWTNIMKSKAWVLPENEDNILRILKLSYDHLPGHLKQCFAYCSLFPEDHVFYKTELVQLWMAQQFIRIGEVSHLESVGGEYFDNLVCMSLFEKHTYYKEAYVMHDLIHNLAELVSEGDCLRLEDNQQKRIMSKTVRHVSIASNRFDPIKIEELCKYENMRTLLFLRRRRFQLGSHLHNLFMKLQRLRVLGLRRCNIKELPASIGTLKHLRFLDLSHNLIGALPESSCNLHNLQVLKLDDCGPIVALPRNMSALINLRHLMTTNDELVSSIQGLGKLTALHELRFDCGRLPMRELADMGILRRLSIWSLEEVKSREEAIESRLDKKEHLDELTLEWDHGSDDHVINPGLEEEVLESLRPTSSIRRLSIYNYGGTRSPSWMEDQSWVTYSSFLETLELDDCVNWEVLPPLGQLRCLTSLEISGMRRVRRIEPAFMECCYALEGGVDKVVLQGFPSLQELEFRNMEEWEEWEVPHGNDGEGDQVVVSHPPRQHHPPFLPRLRNLRIRNCPKLRQLPPLPPTLTKLGLRKVGLSDLPGWLPPPSSPSCSSLSSLEIEDCPNLTSLAGGLLRHPLPNLVRLIIIDCQGLASLPETALGHLTSLEGLWVEKCPNLSWPSCVSVEDTLPPSLESIQIGEDCGRLTDQMMLAIVGSQKLTCLRGLKVVRGPPALRRNLPSSLQELTIYNNEQLDGESLSTWLRGLTSLRRLSIRECPAITSLPRAEALSHLTALEKLEISCLKAFRSFGGGIHCLASLDTLEIEDCPELLDIIVADSSPSSLLPAGMGTTRIRTLRITGSSLQQMKTWLLQCPSLQNLSIRACPQLTGFGGDDGGDVGGELEAALLINLSTTLQRLHFRGCENLRSLPRNLRCLSALKSLAICHCPQIQCLPVAGLPESLQSLSILGCPALKERCKEGEGSDWPLISRIPDLYIW